MDPQEPRERTRRLRVLEASDPQRVRKVNRGVPYSEMKGWLWEQHRKCWYFQSSVCAAG